MKQRPHSPRAMATAWWRVAKECFRFWRMAAEDAWPLLQEYHRKATKRALDSKNRRERDACHAEASLWLGIMLRLTDRQR